MGREGVKMIEALQNYLQFVHLEGDWLNDWATHIPVLIRPIVIIVGQFIAYLIGV